MKHATAEALNLLAPLIVQLRLLPGLKELKLGIFYRRSKPYLHFHEDPLGLFADVRLNGGEFTRYEVNTKAEQKNFLVVAKANCAA